MRLLLITNAFGHVLNGPARFARYLLELNAEPGTELHILTEDGLPDTESLPDHQAAWLEQVHTLHIRIPAWAGPVAPWIRMRRYYRAAQALQQQHGYDGWVYINAWQGSYAASRAPVTVLGMVNDDNLLQATRAQVLARGGRAWIRRYLLARAERQAVHAMPLIYTNSRHLTQALAQAYGVGEGKLGLLYKAVSLPSTAPPFNLARPMDAQPGGLVKILFVKADYLRGGLTTLAQAAELLCLRIGRHIQLQVAGPQPRFEAHIRTLFKQEAPAVELVFLAEQPQAQIHRLLSEADIFCVPALQEALGTANMEAALLGVPIVSTTAGGIPEVLTHGQTALLVPAGNATALSEALLHTIANTPARQARQRAAQVDIQARFSKEAMLARFLALAEEGIAQR